MRSGSTSHGGSSLNDPWPRSAGWVAEGEPVTLPVWNGPLGVPTRATTVPGMVEIVPAAESHVAEVGRLFDLYRQFYECPADLSLAVAYIEERIAGGESRIWVALDGNHGIGFVQCYETFCSVQAVKRWILYDLYVEIDHRNVGLGARLMDTARDAAVAAGARRIDLETASSNAPGQHLYEKLGYRRVVDGFSTYSLSL